MAVYKVANVFDVITLIQQPHVSLHLIFVIWDKSVGHNRRRDLLCLLRIHTKRRTEIRHFGSCSFSSLSHSLLSNFWCWCSEKALMKHLKGLKHLLLNKPKSLQKCYAIQLLLIFVDPFCSKLWRITRPRLVIQKIFNIRPILGFEY